MIAKFVALAAFVAVAYAQADKYPAGVNPHLCPNFPLCDNALLAAYNNPQAAPRAYNPVPQYNPAPIPQYNHAAISALPPGIPAPQQYPAGVSPASCPNYPYCSNHVAAAVAPLPGFAARLYPAGVNPATCPNYPEC